MKKAIYKIQNLVNGKVYIGQTNDIKRRFREHKNKMYGTVSNKHLYYAFDKYGIENFSFEVIEKTEQYNKREQYWIDFFHSNDPAFGYNYEPANKPHSHRGGLSETEIDEITQLLYSTKISFSDIADRYNLASVQTVRDFNRGVIYKRDNIKYPIREDRHSFSPKRIQKIQKELYSTAKTMRQIAEENDCSITTVSQINTGSKNYITNNNDYIYPIRPKTRTKPVLTNETVSNIKEDIKNTSLSWNQLSKKYGVNIKVFQNINNGKTYFSHKDTYPLRKTQKSSPITQEQQYNIVLALKTTNKTQKQIAFENHCSTSVVNSINVGRYHYDPEIKYPIRKK